MTVFGNVNLKFLSTLHISVFMRNIFSFFVDLSIKTALYFITSGPDFVYFVVCRRL